LSLVSTRPATPPRPRGNAVGWIRSHVRAPSDARGLAALFLTFVGARVIVSLVAYAGYILVPTNPAVGFPASFPEYPLLDPWIRGDALSYLIASSPQTWLDTFKDSGGTMPLPLFPALLAFVRWAQGSAVLAGVVIVNVALLLAILVLDRLFTPRFGRAVTIRAVLLLLIFPFGFRFGMAEPYALVLLLASIALWGIDRDRPWLTAVAGTLAVLTQPLGLAIWPAAGLAELRRSRASQSRWRRAYGWLSLAVTPAVLVAYAGYAHSAEGLAWRQVIRTVLGLPGSSLSQALGNADARAAIVVLGFNLLAGVLVLLTTPQVVATLGWPFAAYQLGVLALAGLANPAGLGTGAALAFPAFVVAAASLEKHELGESLGVALSGLGAGLAAAAFVQWYPIAGALAVPPLTSSQPALASFHARMLIEDTGFERSPLDLYAIADDTLVFLGYEPIANRYEPGQSLPIWLYFYTLKAPTQGYLISARLHDRQGRERASVNRTLWAAADEVLFQSTDDASLVPNQYFGEIMHLPIDRAVPPGVYELDVQLFRIPSFAVLPVVGGDGRSSEQLLQQEVVVADQRDLSTGGSVAISHPSNATLGDGIGFLGFDLIPPDPNGGFAVALHWQANTRPTRDYTVFVQALDGQGKVVAQSDSYPWSGGLPTTAWQPGWSIRDVHDLHHPPQKSPETVHLIAGMYRLDTMQRLPVRLSSVATAADHLDLGELVLP
jgi:hypothetical protein